MVIPSDNTNMVKIVGTASGRIFMLGEDANVYELKYQRQVRSLLAALGWQ